MQRNCEAQQQQKPNTYRKDKYNTVYYIFRLKSFFFKIEFHPRHFVLYFYVYIENGFNPEKLINCTCLSKHVNLFLLNICDENVVVVRDKFLQQFKTHFR